MADLTTTERLKRYLGIDPADSDSDEVLADLVASASAWFQKQTGISFGVSPHVDTTTGDGTSEYFTDHFPLASVTSVTIDGAVIPKQGAEGSPGWYVDGGKVCLEGYAFTLRVPVEIAYTAGEDVPADVTQAVTKYAALEYGERGRFGHTQVNVTGEDTIPDQTKSGPSFAAVMSVVNSHRRRSF